jgi:integrase
VPHLSPTTLTTDEQRAVLRVTQANLRDHLIVSLALGTGLRLAEIVGLDVSGVFAPDGTRVRVRVRAAIAKGGRAADVFLPDRLLVKLKKFYRWKLGRGEDLSPAAPLFANQSVAPREPVGRRLPAIDLVADPDSASRLDRRDARASHRSGSDREDDSSEPR